MTPNHYIIDTSSFIDLQKRNPLDLYPSVWGRLISLNVSNLLHIPIAVYEETKDKDDTLAQWMKENKQLFIYESEKQIQIVSSILVKYFPSVKVDKEHEADPWLIALALEIQGEPQRRLFNEETIIVSEEVLKGNKVKIPFLCQEYNLKCIAIFDMFRLEGWKF